MWFSSAYSRHLSATGQPLLQIFLVVVPAVAGRHPGSGGIGIGSVVVHLGYVSFCSVMGDHGSVVRPHEALRSVGRIAVGD
jgi:hypothetical protein